MNSVHPIPYFYSRLRRLLCRWPRRPVPCARRPPSPHSVRGAPPLPDFCSLLPLPALKGCDFAEERGRGGGEGERRRKLLVQPRGGDRKSTRLNSSHVAISYAVFCLKKKRRNRSS